MIIGSFFSCDLLYINNVINIPPKPYIGIISISSNDVAKKRMKQYADVHSVHASIENTKYRANCSQLSILNVFVIRTNTIISNNNNNNKYNM